MTKLPLPADYQWLGALKVPIGGVKLRLVRVKVPKNRTVAMASTETNIHMPFTSANWTVMLMFLIQKEGLLSGTPTICRMWYVLASTQMSPRSRPFSLRFGMICSTYSGTAPKLCSRRKTKL